MKPGLLAFFLILLSCRSTPQISPEQKAHFDEIWISYLKNDSSWPAKRDAAVQNKEDRDFLIQNLIRELVRQTDATGSTEVGRSPQALRAQEELVRLGEFSLPWLLAFFEVDDPAVGNICGQVLSSMGKRVVPFLKQELKSPEPRRRRGCAQALARMSPPEGEEELIQLLAKDPDWVVRAAIATELPRFGNPEIWEALQKALSDPDPFVRKKAAAAMEALKKESGTP